MRPSLLTTVLLGLLLLALSGPSHSLDLTYEHPADEVTAAYLYNFAKFVAWPPLSAENRSTLIIAIADPQLYEAARRTMAGRSVQGRPLQVVRFAGADAVPQPHILYLGRSEAASSAAILAGFKGRPVLTVSDQAGFAEKGGMIELLQIDRKMRFGLNPAAAQAAGLGISSELRELAVFTRGVKGGR